MSFLVKFTWNQIAKAAETPGVEAAFYNSTIPYIT
jgi:hypothetical protein